MVPNGSPPVKETTIAVEESDLKVEKIAAKNGQIAAAVESACRPLREKVFKPSDSYLTDLLKHQHIKTLYNIFGVAIFFLAAYSICNDIFHYGKIYLGWLTIKSGFTGLQYAFGCWCLMHIIALLVYSGVLIWTNIHYLYKKGIRRTCLDALFLLFYIISLSLGFYLCVQCCLLYRLPFPSATFILLESVRLLMKMHAFVRTAIGHFDDPSVTIGATCAPSIRHYVYFLFAPTFIYRSSYPHNTAPTRWTFLMGRFLEILAAVFYFCFFYEQYIAYYYRDFGSTAPKLAQVVEDFFRVMLPSTLALLVFIFMLLHSVQNFFAEVLHFSDRRFYTNWWSATNYRDYFVRWNCVVHEWLYEYIYKDIYTYVCANRFICSLTVVTISAVVHEIIIGLALHLFFPINYISFGILSYVLMLVPLRGRFGNVVMWLCLIFGLTLQISLYSMEYFAKQNCPKAFSEGFLRKLEPHILTCFMIRN